MLEIGNWSNIGLPVLADLLSIFALNSSKRRLACRLTGSVEFRMRSATINASISGHFWRFLSVEPCVLSPSLRSMLQR